MHTSRTALPPTIALLAFSFVLSARPAAAQYGTLNLSSGDIVTVTGAGTVSNRAGGSNATGSYDAGNNLEAVDAESGSAFNLAGGTITGEDGDSAIFASGATVTVSSGLVSSSGSGTDGLDAANGSTVTISGGSFAASGGGSGSAPAALAPAALASPGPALSAVDLYVDSGSRVRVTGGLFTASGTGAVGLYAINNGVITLFGTGFTVNGSPVTGPLTSGSGTIGGTLLSGSALTNLPYTVLGGSIQFAPAAAPEPSQYAAFAIGVLSLGGLALRARRKDAAA